MRLGVRDLVANGADRLKNPLGCGCCRAELVESRLQLPQTRLGGLDLRRCRALSRRLLLGCRELLRQVGEFEQARALAVGGLE